MKDSTIFNKIKEMLNSVVSENSLAPTDIETNLNEYMNSIHFVYMVVKLEEEFDIEIPNKYLGPKNLNSIKEIESIVVELLNNT